jgi:RNA recognition motif-containing protein
MLYVFAEQGYSVFVKNLPFNTTIHIVEEEFKKFGGIKPGGIQVRNRVSNFFLVVVVLATSYFIFFPPNNVDFTAVG